eukprot:gnl/MRDRNA2_/MRDRNA2_84921_c0_seq2.p1 gnl/MRDRNA2_/MRDRNA2_84921_c0~~gnl/MRDRNA2_/MRDRNA2_84921_c0_seq2.p1  ORF type:complete len:299 (+),score=31.33 gnl/MRDRNA2_/MRDRNA2_84921_c0_seq2:98-898(+)
MPAPNEEATEKELRSGFWSFMLGPTCMTYKGTFFNHPSSERPVKHGKGVLKWDNGREYSGEFVNDQFHGSGIMSWPTGEKYEGTYVNNLKDGLGKFSYPVNSRQFSFLEGNWCKGMRHGDMIRYDPSFGYAKATYEADQMVSTELIPAQSDFTFKPDYDIFARSEGNDSCSESTCAICCNELCKGDTCIRTSCNHVFHKECMDMWMDRKLECPLCRQKVQKHSLCITDCGTSVPSGTVSQEATCPAIRGSARELPNHHTGSSFMTL